ncbi:hypothetical protein K443DRAFT_347473 [Laccaria amethystina LaAM-08-1]|uniref:Uncharacterized protein n=1 Tax=Laccaria amethystina LaAM-08-1 TaxID=1095629 RepID=A0A0C9X0N2_9AGAR|nr:hypothetical protein K443DRAFT_347473 [Laccaria amethystina LaAM-08-1]
MRTAYCDWVARFVGLWDGVVNFLAKVPMSLRLVCKDIPCRIPASHSCPNLARVTIVSSQLPHKGWTLDLCPLRPACLAAHNAGRETGCVVTPNLHLSQSHSQCPVPNPRRSKHRLIVKLRASIW